jgi:putative FmdB family regulatory protein
VPIYEFYCPHCHRIFNFLSRRVDTQARPPCPRCERSDLVRRASLFAISKGRKAETAPATPERPEMPGLPPGLDEARLERAMESLASEAESIDENDPRQGVQLMRRLFDATGLPMGKGMEEALRRMESGEDPEKVEEEMGDLLEDPFGAGPEAGDAPGREPSQRLGIAGLRRRVLPPSLDPELYEM